MPDIDVDFCFERRGEVIEYVRQKYGKESVGQIVTFGTMKSRAAIKDVGRTLGFTPAETDALAKLIPNGPNFSLTVKEAIKDVPEIAQAVQDRRALRAAARLRDRARRAVAPHGRARGRRRHRAGSARRLRADLHASSSKGAGAGNEETGRRHAVRHELPREGGHVEDGLPRPDDAHGHPRRARQHRAADRRRVRTSTRCRSRRSRDYRMLRAGRTTGVFQFESALATDMLRSMRCDRFDDLVASQRADAPRSARRGHAQGLSAPQARRGAGDRTRCPSSSRSSSRRTASSPIRSR